MINKMKSKAMHYWSKHKIECLVVAVLVIAYIVKQNYGDSQDGLQIYNIVNNFVVFTGYFRTSSI